MSTGAVLLWLACAVIAGVITERKNLGPWTGFLLGALLNVFGIVIAICLRRGLPKPPAGLVAVKCPRCNTVQNVPKQQTEFECWQCHLVEPVSTAVRS